MQKTVNINSDGRLNTASAQLRKFGESFRPDYFLRAAAAKVQRDMRATRCLDCLLELTWSFAELLWSLRSSRSAPGFAGLLRREQRAGCEA